MAWKGKLTSEKQPRPPTKSTEEAKHPHYSYLIKLPGRLMYGKVENHSNGGFEKYYY